MGRLYIAERRGVRGFVKIVALKRILPHLADSAQLRDMFLNEARIAARLEHPNIVATYELGEVEGKYFISMEYLPGEDLSAVIGRCQGGAGDPDRDRRRRSPSRSRKGLHYAHDVRDGQGRLIGLVHRDVNPRNIFVTYHGGREAARFRHGEESSGPEERAWDVFKGKYGYCAPEQLEGGRIDRRTDVFCLGIVLWECLTGSRLFDVGTDVETIDAVRSRRIERPGRAAARSPPRAGGDRPAGAGARTGAALPERARDVRGAGSVPARSKEPAHATSIGQWMEAIFGSERAALKKSISQGDNVEGALHRLKAIDAVNLRRPIGRGRRAVVRRRNRARSGRRASAPPARRRARGGEPPAVRAARGTTSPRPGRSRSPRRREWAPGRSPAAARRGSWSWGR